MTYTGHAYSLIATNGFRGGKWRYEGMDSGRIEIVRLEGDILTVKENGYSYFGGQGMPFIHAPTCFSVFRVTGGSLDDGRIQLIKLTSWLSRPRKDVARLDAYKP